MNMTFFAELNTAFWIKLGIIAGVMLLCDILIPIVSARYTQKFLWRVNRAEKLRVYLRILYAEFILLQLLYVGGVFFFLTRFMPKTYVNGTEVSMMDPFAAEDTLRAKYDSYEIKILEQNRSAEYITGEEIDLAYEIEGSMERTVFAQDVFLWFVDIFRRTDFDLEVKGVYDERKLTACAKNLSCIKDPLGEGTELPKIVKGDDAYTVQANEASVVDYDRMMVALKAHVSMLKPSVSLKKTGCYVEADFSEEIAVLQDAVDRLNRIKGLSFTYEMGEDTLTLTGDQILAWMTVSEDGQMSLDEDALSLFLQGVRGAYAMHGMVPDVPNEGASDKDDASDEDADEDVDASDQSKDDRLNLLDADEISKLILELDEADETTYICRPMASEADTTEDTKKE